MQKCFRFKCRDFHGFVYIRVGDSLHVSWDVTTNTDPHASGLEYKCVPMYAHIKIVTRCLQGQWYVMSSACPVKLACSRIHKSTAQWSAVQ